MDENSSPSGPPDDDHSGPFAFRPAVPPIVRPANSRQRRLGRDPYPGVVRSVGVGRHAVTLLLVAVIALATLFAALDVAPALAADAAVEAATPASVPVPADEWPISRDIVATAALLLVIGSLVVAFFAMLVEIALANISTAKLLGDDDGTLAKRYRLYLDHEDETRTVCQLARMLTAMFANAIAILGIGALTGPTVAIAPATVFIAFAAVAFAWLLLVNAIAPMWATHHAESTLRRLLGPITLLSTLMRPMLFPVRTTRVVLARLAGLKVDTTDPEDEVIEDIREAVDEGAREGVLGKEERSMIERVIRFRDADASDIMTPRTDMVSVSSEATVTEALRMAYEHGHSRIPVFEGNQDKIVGVFFTRDLLGPLSNPNGGGKNAAAGGDGDRPSGRTATSTVGVDGSAEAVGRARTPPPGVLTAADLAAAVEALRESASAAESDGASTLSGRLAAMTRGSDADLRQVFDVLPVRAIMRPAVFVPETKALYTLLAEMRGKKLSMAIVLDEYGGTAGLVTMEDILEEIVGEIQDEYDEEENIETAVDGIYDVDARTEIDEVNERLNLSIPEHADYDTLAGYLVYRMGKVPLINEQLEENGYRFTVVESDERRIVRVRIEMHAQAAEPAASSQTKRRGGTIKRERDNGARANGDSAGGSASQDMADATQTADVRNQ